MPVKHPDKIPSLVFANNQGEIIDLDAFHMAGNSGGFHKTLNREDLIELPEGSELFVLPRRFPIGIDIHSNKATVIRTNPYDPNDSPQAVAAFMAPAHTSLFTAAYEKIDVQAPLLPLFAYTAVGWSNGKFWVTGFRSDTNCRQDYNQFKQHIINKKTNRQLKAFPNNRLIQHLGKCCLTYGCPAARNYFLNRWEAPLPTSPVCNASCIGCISLQPSGCCSATQDRIKFVPTPQEIAEIAIPHIKKAAQPVVSFGQGCEGEPLLQWETLEKSIKLIRSQTNAGTINLNTNGSLPEKVSLLASAGLDSIRVSLNSAREEAYTKYYRPNGFHFSDILETMKIMKKFNRHVSLNYFILPGFTDDPAEFAALCNLIENCKPDLIQLRNLNMDPEHYLQSVQHAPCENPLGINIWLNKLQSLFPLLKFGYFNPYLHKGE